MERISNARSILQKRDYHTSLHSLQRLVQVLQDMKKYIEKITQYNTVQNLLLQTETIKKIQICIKSKTPYLSESAAASVT